jgi:hypothetical protein
MRWRIALRVSESEHAPSRSVGREPPRRTEIGAMMTALQIDPSRLFHLHEILVLALVG